MPADILSRQLKRRSLLKAGLLVGAAQVAAPFLIKVRGEEPIKIGLDDPLTGVYAALGKNERLGCEYAVDQIGRASCRERV